MSILLVFGLFIVSLSIRAKRTFRYETIKLRRTMSACLFLSVLESSQYLENEYLSTPITVPPLQVRVFYISLLHGNINLTK